VLQRSRDQWPENSRAELIQFLREFPYGLEEPVSAERKVD